VYTISEAKFPTENILVKFLSGKGDRIKNLKNALKITQILIRAHHLIVQM